MISKIEKPELVVVTLNQPASWETVLAEIEKAGLRPLTIEEFEALQKNIENTKRTEREWKDNTPYLFLRR